jgi:predicted enzyme related to lactoylglutathione lyase
LGQPIVHFEIMGKSTRTSRSFYADLFGWNIGDPMPDMGNYALVDAGTSGVAGGIGEEPDGATRVTVYVQVPDLQATLDRAVANGGKVVMPPMEIPGVVSIAQFADPDGNVIGLTKG